MVSLGMAYRQGRFHRWGRQYEAVADPQVEGMPDVGLWNLARLLQPLEQGGTLPAEGIDHGMHPSGKAAGQVLRQATTGDVGHAVDGYRSILKCLHQVPVDPGGRQQGLDDAAFAGPRGGSIYTLGLQDASHQAEAIAVHP